MSSIRELRVVLNHHQTFQKNSSVASKEVMVYRRASLGPNKNSKNPLKMKIKPETTSKRLTRSSLKTPLPPDPPKPRPRAQSAGKGRGRPKKSTGMTIKREIKQEQLEKTPINKKNNIVKRDYPLRKRQKPNPTPTIDLSGPDISEIKQEVQSECSSTLDLSDSPTSEKVKLNDAFLDKTNDETMEVSMNNENDQNMNNKHMNNSMNSTEEVDYDTPGDLESLIKVHVITISETDGSEKSKSSGDQQSTDGIETQASKSSETHQMEDLEEIKDPSGSKMKCLTEIISEVFDSKLPDCEERIYFTLQHLMDEYNQEKRRKEMKRDAERKKYERMVLSNVQGIKLMLGRMNKKRVMIDEETQTDEALDHSGESTGDPVDHLDVQQHLEEAPEDQNLEKSPGETPAEESEPLLDPPAVDLDKMIVLDSLECPSDHQGSVFQRLGNISPVKSTQGAQEYLESPENPSPGPLQWIELQREVIERHNRECNIVIEGFRCSKNRVEADISEHLWKKMGISAGVSRVMRVGEGLVVTVASLVIKKQILKRRGVLHRSIRIASDYTGREKRVQQWLGDEARRRQRAGENVRAAYGRILVGGVWWFWNELQGKLTRIPFRPELVSMSK